MLILLFRSRNPRPKVTAESTHPLLFRFLPAFSKRSPICRQLSHLISGHFLCRRIQLITYRSEEDGLQSSSILPRMFSFVIQLCIWLRSEILPGNGIFFSVLSGHPVGFWVFRLQILIALFPPVLHFHPSNCDVCFKNNFFFQSIVSFRKGHRRKTLIPFIHSATCSSQTGPESAASPKSDSSATASVLEFSRKIFMLFKLT